MLQDLLLRNKNRPTMPAAPAIMIAEVMLSNESHAIGNPIPNAMKPAHQFNGFFSGSVMTTKIARGAASRLRLKAENHTGTAEPRGRPDQ